MSILSKLTGAAQGNSARGVKGRSTTGKGMGGGRSRATGGRGDTGGGFQGFSRGGRTTTGRGAAQPSSAGGLGKLIGSFKRR